MTAAKNTSQPDSALGNDPVVDGAALELLEILESLTVVYESAEFFADVASDKSIAEYTLVRCLEAIGSASGAIYFASDRDFELQAEQADASKMLRRGAIDLPTNGALFRNDAAAAPYLTEAGAGRSLLYSPIAAGKRRLGVVAIVGDEGQTFTTKDAKLISAVTSQAAIALSSALHYRAVAIERSKLRSIIEDNRGGIIVLTPTGQTVICNSVARHMFGIREEEAAGTDFPTILGDWNFDHGFDIFESETDTVEISCGTGVDELVLALRSRIVRDADDAIANIIITIEDLTEKRREERLKKDFLSLISHKFRTPLTGIVGSLVLLGDDADENRQEILAEANSRVEELSILVDRLLYFAEIIEGSWSAAGLCDLCELQQEIQSHFTKRYEGRTLQIEWDIGDGARLVGLPASRMRVLLDNLIDNAIKFSPKDPWVRITTEKSDTDEILMRVTDRGPGIPPREVERIFESFYQTDEDFTGAVPGAGLGLSIVGEIVRRVGGMIEVCETQPHGTVFTLSLPGGSTAPE